MENGHFDHFLLGRESPQSPLLDALDNLEESWTPKDLDRGQDWVTSNTSGLLYSFDLKSSWEFLAYAYHFRGPVKNVVNNLSVLTGSPELTFERDSDANAWETIALENKFPWRFTHTIRNTYLFNDYLSVIHKDGGKTPSIQGYPPYTIGDIVVSDEDPEEVLHYKRADQKGGYDPDECIHHRIDKIGNDKRGVPLFNAVLRELVYYYKWLEDLYYVGHMRARIPIVRKVKGGSSEVTAEKNRFDYLPGPGRIAVENYGTEWQYPPQYGGMSDAREGWETFCQAIALAMNLPYFLVSSDYRNNSLASTLTADSPTTRLIKWYRSQFTSQFIDMVRNAIGSEGVELEVTWPPVVERDKKKEAEAYEIGIRTGAISAQTMCEEVYGLEWDKEQERIDQESAKAQKSWGMGNNPEPGPIQ